MKSILIPVSNTKQEYKDLQERLEITKNSIDAVFADPKRKTLWEELDLFKTEKKFISQITGTPITNAWLKCYEMLNYYKIMPDNCLHFDNAAFPGAFIMASQFFAKRNKITYSWKASSLFEENVQDKDPLGDTFGLFRNHKNNWLTGSNGDVLKESTQQYFASELGDRVDLYTSDLGFDVSQDYNKQEELHYLANAGQILSGMLTLKSGGNMITKQYTFFNAKTIWLIKELSNVFKKLYICKPATSRPTNSEVYIVGMEYQKSKKFIDKLYDIINNKSFPEASPTKEIIAASEIFEEQILRINHSLNTVNSKEWLKNNEKILQEWYNNNEII